MSPPNSKADFTDRRDDGERLPVAGRSRLPHALASEVRRGGVAIGVPHYGATGAMTRICSDCPGSISRQSKTGRCRPCSLAHTNANPAIREKQRVAVTAWANRPEVRRACAARLAQHAANMPPEERERRRAQGRHIAATVLHSPAVRERSNSREAKAKAGRARTNTVLAWCPPAYRDQYRALTASQRMHAADARAMIEDQIAADSARLSPFERDMARLAAGAQLVAAPDFRTAGPAFTLGGVATGML